MPPAPPLRFDSDATSRPVALDKDGQCTTASPLLSLIDVVALKCDDKTGEFILNAHYRAGHEDNFVEITTDTWQGSCDVLAVTSDSSGQLDLAVNPSITVFKITVKDAYGQPLKGALNEGVAVKNANAVEVGPGVHSVFLSDQVYGFPSQLTAARTAEGDRVRLEHTRESTCAGYAGGTATCTATYVADARSHLTVFASAEVTTITLTLGVLLPGVPLCSESVAGYDSNVGFYFESPLGCPMFDNVSFITKKLLEITNATATALEVASTSCTSATEPDVHRRALAPAAASVAFLFHTRSREEAEKIVALLPVDESAFESTFNVPVIPGSVKISVTQDESALASTLNVPVIPGIRAPSESSDLHRKPVELLAGVGVPVLIACCLGVLVLISCGIFVKRCRRRASVHPVSPPPAEGKGQPPNPLGLRFHGFFAARARVAEQTPQQVQRDWLYWMCMMIGDEDDDARP